MARARVSLLPGGFNVPTHRQRQNSIGVIFIDDDDAIREREKSTSPYRRNDDRRSAPSNGAQVRRSKPSPGIVMHENVLFDAYLICLLSMCFFPYSDF